MISVQSNLNCRRAERAPSEISNRKSQISTLKLQKAQTILNNTAEASSTRNSANTPVNFPPSAFASDRVTKLSAINVAEATSDSVSFVPRVRCLGQITFECACISSSRQVTGSLNRFLKGLRRELGLIVLIFPAPRDYWRRGFGPDELILAMTMPRQEASKIQ